MYGSWTYLIYELGWFLPVILLQWAVGWRELWRARRAWLLTIASATTYLSVADRFAIADGIWHISPDRSTGVMLGRLPLEEAIFFFGTNMMVVQAMLLFMSRTVRERIGTWLRGRYAVSDVGSAHLRLHVYLGYRRGLLGAVLGAVVTSLVVLAVTDASALEPVAQVVMQATPVAIANLLLQWLGPAASPLALLGALAAYMCLGGAFGALDGLGIAAGGRWGSIARGVGACGLAGTMVSVARETSVVAAVAFAFGQATVIYAPDILRIVRSIWVSVRRRTPGRSPSAEAESGQEYRRRSLADTSVIVAGAGAVVGIAFADMARRDQNPGLAGTELETFVVPPPRRDGFPVEGQPPEVTPVAQFYVVSKNAQDPRVDVGAYRLRIGGLVARPTTLRFDDLTALPRRDAFVTFQCVSNPVGGSLMSAAHWTGVALHALLERVEPLVGAERVVLRAPDGHEESVPLATARRPDALLAYAMNGAYLTRLHGHPVRAVLPGHHGFKQVKWLTAIDLAPADHRGYWPTRGWTDTAEIRTTARIDLVRPDAGGVWVAGMALAGRRGVKAVEIRLGDGGVNWSPWIDTELHLPALGSSMWVQWRVRVPSTPSQFIEARAIDDTGSPQDPTESPPYPNGSSGYHRAPVVAFQREVRRL